jgi:hypothetical protein
VYGHGVWRRKGEFRHPWLQELSQQFGGMQRADAGEIRDLLAAGRSRCDEHPLAAEAPGGRQQVALADLP